MTRVQCGVALISHLFPDKSILKKSQSSFIHTDAVVMPNITQSVSFSGYLLRCLPHRYTHHSKFITLPLMLCYVNHNLILSKCNSNQAVSLRCYLLSGSQHTEVSEERTPIYWLKVEKKMNFVKKMEKIELSRIFKKKLKKLNLVEFSKKS